MGADIHMLIEYRNRKRAQEDQKAGRQSNWFSYGGQINPGRNYTLFGILAGVRGQYPDSFEPKGKLDPDEMGKPTRVEPPDWHSHSWMTTEELEEAFSRYQVHATQEWGEQISGAPLEYRAALAAMKELEDGGENEVRVVFWFDD